MNKIQGKNNGKAPLTVALVLLGAILIAMRSVAINGRVLGLEEAKLYFSFCETLGVQIPLWLFRCREIIGMALGIMLAILGLLLLKKYWVSKRKAYRSFIGLCGVLCAIATLWSAFSLADAVEINREHKEKMVSTVEKVRETEETKLLFNQKEYEDLFLYYFDDMELVWHNEAQLEQIEEEYVYMLYEDGAWFDEALVAEYGVSYTDLGELWFEGAESLRLYKVHWGEYGAWERSQKNIEQIWEKEADKALVSMFEMSNFKAEYFELFLGGSMVNFEEVFLTGTQLVASVEMTLLETETVKNLYLGVNPLGFDERNWEDLKALLQGFPDVEIEIFFHYPNKEMLLKDGALDQYGDALARGVNCLNESANAHMTFVGAETWVFLNDDNMVEGMGYADEMAYYLTATALINKSYGINVDNIADKLGKMEDMIVDVRNGAYEYEFLNDKTILFFGDSIIESIHGCFSVPGVVAGLTDARTYHLGYGGMTAAFRPGLKVGVWGVVMGVLTSDCTSYNLLEKPYFCEQVQLVTEDKVLTDNAEGENLVFVFAYGLNDYFEGLSIGEVGGKDKETYVGALEVTIEMLQERYPKADYVLLGQNHIIEENYGNNPKGSEGNILDNYRDALKELADCMNIGYIDMNEATGLTQDNLREYLNDRIHLNHFACFAYGKAISDYLEELMRGKER